MKSRFPLANCITALLAIATIAFSPIAYAGAAQWPRAGEIAYEVLRGEGGLKLGEAVHRWEHDGQRYSMRTEVETTGLAGALYDFRYVQKSEGTVLENGLRPRLFRVEQNGREPETATFEWKGKTVLIERRKGRKETFDVAPGDQDVLSVWHLMGLRAGKDLPAELTLVTNRTAAPATLEIIGRESLRLPIGQVEALRVRVRARSGRLSIDLWLSEQHELLPVRILMEDDKGEVLDQQAIAINIGTANAGSGKNVQSPK